MRVIAVLPLGFRSLFVFCYRGSSLFLTLLRQFDNAHTQTGKAAQPQRGEREAPAFVEGASLHFGCVCVCGQVYTAVLVLFFRSCIVVSPRASLSLAVGAGKRVFAVPSLLPFQSLLIGCEVRLRPTL